MQRHRHVGQLLDGLRVHIDPAEDIVYALESGVEMGYRCSVGPYPGELFSHLDKRGGLEGDDFQLLRERRQNEDRIHEIRYRGCRATRRAQDA
jgi:hypothetical protein